MAGLSVPTVPFRTTGEVMTGLISGNIQAAFETIPGVIGQINAGEMRAIARVVDQAQSVPAGCPDHRRERRAELSDLFLERHGRAGQDAAATS